MRYTLNWEHSDQSLVIEKAYSHQSDEVHSATIW